MKSLLTGAAAALALALGVQAQAAVVLLSPDGTNVLRPDNSISLDNDDLVENGPLIPSNNTAGIVVGGPLDQIVEVTLDVNDSNGDVVGIRNAVLSVTGDMGTSLSFDLTDGDGVQILEGFTFTGMVGEILTVVVSGTGFTVDPPFTGDYNIRFISEYVPVPAAAVLFATALAGGLLARRGRVVA